MSAVEVHAERIVAVAVRHKGLVVTLPAPARHADVCRPLFEITQEAIQWDDFGFLTSTGRFVGRREATSVAARSGQLTKDPMYPPDLYSEDMW